MRRRAGALSAILALLFCNAWASAATSGAMPVALVDDAGRPIANARITASSPSGSFTVTTDAAGRAAFLDLPPDTYTFTASVPGFDVVPVSGVTVQADQTALIVLTATRRVTPTPRPSPTPRPTAAPTPSSDTWPVQNAALSMYNDTHPVHAAGTPYFGRYSYVLLHDGDNVVRAKNRAFVTALMVRYAPPNTTIVVGPPEHRPNPWSYNVFFFPVVGGMHGIKLGSDKHAAVNAVLAAYDFTAADAVRTAYCAVPAHVVRSPCTLPWRGGPIVFTFLKPLAKHPTPGGIPPAFAYDFTRVPADQLEGPLDQISKTISISAAIRSDTLLPPPFAAKIAAELDRWRIALVASITGVRIWVDKNFGH